MSRIDDLVAEHCADGVPFRRLGDVASFRRGSVITRKDVLPGDIPVIAGGRTPAYFHVESNRDGPSIAVGGSGANAGFVSYWDGPIFVSDAFTVHPSEVLSDPKYVYYVLKSKQSWIHDQKRGGGVPHVYGRDLEPILIPLPPLEVQREIVRILDTFTELEAELEAELEGRRQQYEYYRDLLLWERQGRKLMSLGDIGPVLMCKRVMKDQTAATGDVPFFKIGTFGSKPDSYISFDLFMEYKDRYPYPRPGSLLISAAGTIGRVVRFNGEPSYFQDSNIVWIDNDERLVSNSYLKHWLSVVSWVTDGGTIRRLYNDNIRRTPIWVPSPEVQREISAALDSFDTLVNDLSGGLPAELTARRRQYEYFRDRLLMFTEAA